MRIVVAPDSFKESMTAAMRAYQRDGMEFAAAGVDSDSPTGAVDLYRELGYAPTQGSILYALDV